MKHLTVLSVSALFGLTACETMNQPLTGGDFDPLMPPGGAARSTGNQAGFRGGDLVRAVMDNTAFYKKLPKGEADADKLLLRGTGMKVVRVAGSYLQVEIDTTGEVGYVPSVMVESASSTAPGTVPGVGTIPGPGEYQVYPPLPGGGALPPIDPTGQPPEGAIPAVIDPSLPNTPVPNPGAAPAPVDPAQPGASPTPPAAPAKTPAATESPTPEPPVQPTEETPAKPAGTTPEKAAESP